MRKLWIGWHLALVAALLLAPAALAQEGDPVEFTGTVTAIDLDAGTFTAEAEDGTVYTVVPPEGFDLTGLAVGDVVEVEGTLAEDGSVLATSITVEEPEEIQFTGTVMGVDLATGTFTVETDDGTIYTVVSPEGFDLTALAVGDEVEVEGILAADGSVLATSIKVLTEDEEEIGYFCREDTEMQHPFAAALAETYGVEYDQVMAWFCDGGFGFGQIMLALMTQDKTGASADETLARRAGGEGWGQIWISMQLVGKPSDVNPPGAAAGADAGSPFWSGAPDGAGKPEGVGPPDGVGGGKPSWAGGAGGGGDEDDGE